MVTWIQLLLVVVCNVAVVAFFFGRLSAKVEALADLVKRLCGDHDDIRANTQTIAEHEKKLEWGTHRFDEIFRAIYALARGERFTGLSSEPPP